MIEEYTGTTDYPPEDNLKGQCRVRFQIAPYHDEQPGLRMLYEYKGTVRYFFFSLCIFYGFILELCDIFCKFY
jgi:hypothetical protein